DVAIDVLGEDFVSGATLVIGTTTIPTTFIASDELTGTIPAPYLLTPGVLKIGARNPLPGGGLSASTLSVSVGGVNPIPTLTAIRPRMLVVSTPDHKLTLNGDGFAAGSTIFFGSMALPTRFLTSVTIEGTVPMGLLAMAGPVAVTVVNPTPG